MSTSAKPTVIYLPASLPPTPAGWTFKLKMHMSAADGRGRYGIYVKACVDDAGRETPITHQAPSRPAADVPLGFYVPWSETVFPTWAALAAAWPQLFLAAAEWKPKA